MITQSQAKPKVKGSKWALTTREKMFKEAQAYFTSHNPDKISLVDELITERHKLAEEE